ncbi:DUF4185 domain-containing protein [Mycobacterium sp. SM1]|uniref:DUF4185 domain-containing protein n=1 Tax=Mycobacterium sp. SM1 TaxID=2816243 RepID=UPI001BCB3F93|nr:DUF4185 domain-containing protein [Mycobacterium sp. SM1]MBS4728178.1 DUF4185 domain-containing protein [Mycobacterium sp. SM1]
MAPVPRIVSLTVAPAAAIGFIAAVGLAPPVTALPCTAPEANVDPPAATPVTPAPAPVVRPPSGRRPRGANENAPLPRLGPLISALLHPGTRYAAPVQQQAAIIPPPPTPPGAGNQAPPDAAQLSPNAAQPSPEPPASIAGAPTSLVEWVTGPNSPNKTLERFGISGTDLGILWDNGDPVNRQVLMAFGDTFGYCRVHGQQWRYNTLFRSGDRNLSDGISVGPGVPFNKYSGSPVRQVNFSKQILPGIKWAPTQEGMIPTAGISVGRTQYINFMSIKRWGRDGEWATNYSAIAMSPDNGQNWGIYPGTVRTPSPDSVPGVRYVPGNENFQMGAFMRPGDGYVYSFGTPAGRGGSAYLARVPQNFVPDLTKYQYWNGESNTWVPNNPGAATPVIPGPVGEMSAQYNNYLKQYLVLYTNGANDVVARTAPAPQGPWSPEQLLVSSFQMPGGIYAPMIHPWSSGKDLYFNLSLWSAYDVMLMHTELP